MLIIGERINSTRKKIAKAVRARDAEFIRTEATNQTKAGAGYIDVNAGTSVAHEVEDLVWLAETVQSAVDAPLCLDSANPAAIDAALKVLKCPPFINSITGEKARIAGTLPMVVKANARVIALVMGDEGMPEDVDGRVKAAHALAKVLTGAGVGLDRVYFDPLIRPVSTNPDQAKCALEATRRIMTELPGAHTVCGLSNVSFGLPSRNILNRTFLAMMIAAGLDAVVIDPTEPGMMPTVYAAEALAARDEYGMNYIAAAREGKLEQA